MNCDLALKTCFVAGIGENKLKTRRSGEVWKEQEPGGRFNDLGSIVFGLALVEVKLES